MIEMPAYIAGVPVVTGSQLEVRYPWDGSLTGRCSLVGRAEYEQAVASALAPGNRVLSRHERAGVLRRAAGLLEGRREAFARLITRETGLSLLDARHETVRCSDVLEFAAMEALQDDGRVYSCDITAGGKARKVYTLRFPVALVAAVTPFNHPLNQVVHKTAPAIAAGAPMLLKPSERAPLVALKFAELLYEAGLPGWMLSAFVGPVDDVVGAMIDDERVEVLTFTGSVEVGKAIARRAGYKKLCLELGGNSPLIVLADADLALAARLACEGAFRNSGQRCTAIKRILVVPEIMEAFTERLVAEAAAYVAGDPEDEATVVGTVIHEEAAALLERRVRDAVACGARVLHGGGRRGALLEPTVLVDVPRDAEVVHEESFGPLAPVVAVRDLDDAIAYYNAGRFGLSTSVVTRDLEAAIKAVRELKTGTTNINEVPGYRLEHTPFGGIRDSGLGIKEGVAEAAKFFSHTKTYSLPW